MRSTVAEAKDIVWVTYCRAAQKDGTPMSEDLFNTTVKDMKTFIMVVSKMGIEDIEGLL